MDSRLCFLSLIILSVIQHMYGMDNQIVLASEQNKKCFLVAQYLTIYPQGKNENEKQQIESFLAERKSDNGSERAALSKNVNGYLQVFYFIRNNTFAALNGQVIDKIMRRNFIEVHKNENGDFWKADIQHNEGVKCFNNELDKVVQEICGADTLVLFEKSIDILSNLEGYALLLEANDKSFKVCVSCDYDHDDFSVLFNSQRTQFDSTPFVNEKNAIITLTPGDVIPFTNKPFNLFEKIIAMHNNHWRSYIPFMVHNQRKVVHKVYGSDPYEIDEKKFQVLQDFPQSVINNEVFKTILGIRLSSKNADLSDSRLVRTLMLINSLLPDLMFRYISDISAISGCDMRILYLLGSVINFSVSYGSGQYLLPYFSAYSSFEKACVKQEKINPESCKGGMFFLFSSCIQGVLSFMGNTCLVLPSFGDKVCGGIVHLIRMLLFYYMVDWPMNPTSFYRNNVYKMGDLNLMKIVKKQGS